MGNKESRQGTSSASQTSSSQQRSNQTGSTTSGRTRPPQQGADPRNSAQQSRSNPSNSQSSSRSSWRSSQYPGMASQSRRQAAPGVYSVPGRERRGATPSQSQLQPQQQAMYVTVPYGVRPGQNFPVIANGQRLMVRCPEGVRPGAQIRIIVQNPNAPPPSSSSSQLHPPAQQQAFMVTVPSGVYPGHQFPVIMPNGQQMRVTCPTGARPGSQVRIVVNLSQQSGRDSSGPTSNRNSSNTSIQPMQTFMVQVPPGVRPGQPFALIANGQRVMVTCPQNVRPGQTIRFQLPRAPPTGAAAKENLEDIAKTMGIPLKYNKDAWVRCMGEDMTLRWAKQEKEDEKESESSGRTSRLSRKGSDSFERGQQLPKDAFVRQFTSDGDLEWIKAEDFSLEPTVPGTNITYSALTMATNLPFKRKLEWFRDQVAKLRIPWEEGHMRVSVRREFMLDDASEAFENVGIPDLRKIFRFEFVGEPGLDAGGVAREFYDQVTEQLFNPDFALFQYSAVDQLSMQINPYSGFVNEDHLRYFHFAGRLMAKALFDQQIIKVHLALPLYKHILAWPISIADLEYLDRETYEGLKKMSELEDVSVCCLDFTVMEQQLGVMQTIELKENGPNIDVANENFNEYILLMLEYRMLKRVSKQLAALLSGFYEVLPVQLMSVFDFQELELLLCGLPHVNVDDWIEHTEYKGQYARDGRNHKVIQWFWEVIREYDEEQRARLLQFATGTSRVPVQGFGVLQGSDGNIQPFTITSTEKSQSLFPQAHTCFNRIDLPLYDSKDELKNYLTLAIQMEATGFGLE